MTTGTAVTRALVHALHVLAWALCYGAITYTHFRLNRLLRGFTGSDEDYESAAALLARGLHQWTLGALALAGVTGAVLAVWRPETSPANPDTRSTLLIVKAAILVALAMVQEYAGRVMWPRRRRTRREGWPSERRRLFWSACLMGFLLLAQLALGALLYATAPYASH